MFEENNYSLAHNNNRKQRIRHFSRLKFKSEAKIKSHSVR